MVTNVSTVNHVMAKFSVSGWRPGIWWYIVVSATVPPTQKQLRA